MLCFYTDPPMETRPDDTKPTNEPESQWGRYTIPSLRPAEELFRRAAEIQRAAGLPERRKMISPQFRFLIHR